MSTSAGTPNAIAEAAIRDAIESIKASEKLIADLDRAGIMRKLIEMQGAFERLSQLQHDMRIARIRLQSCISDPDKTPVHGISTATMRRVELQLASQRPPDPGKKDGEG